MPRRVAKDSGSDVPLSGSVTVVSGSIREPDDQNALSVKLSIWDSEVTMRADGAELGNWPTTAVDIRPLDSRVFEFIAEGDRLIFTPDEPDTLAQHPLVASRAGVGGRRRGRKAKQKKSPDDPPQLLWDQSSPEEERRNRQRPKAQKPKPEKRKKQSRQERKAAAARADAAVVQEPASPKPEKPKKQSRQERKAASIALPTDDTARSVAKNAKPREARERTPREPRRSRRVEKADQPKPESTRSERFKEKRHQAWIFALDKARQYDFLGLDRVPVNESLRGKEHQHTWDHRVAPTSGFGKYICTICGEIRQRS